MHLKITGENVSYHSDLGCGISPMCTAKSWKAGGMSTQLISLLLLCRRHKLCEIQFSFNVQQAVRLPSTVRE